MSGSFLVPAILAFGGVLEITEDVNAAIDVGALTGIGGLNFAILQLNTLLNAWKRKALDHIG